MKLLNDIETYGQPLYGYQLCNNRFFVNVERLWEDSGKDENLFIQNYTKVYMHEYLHSLIHDIIRDLYVEKEEEVIDILASSENIKTKKKWLIQKCT